MCGVPEQRLPSAVPEAPTDTLTHSGHACPEECMSRAAWKRAVPPAQRSPRQSRPDCTPDGAGSGHSPGKGRRERQRPATHRPQKAPSGIRRPASLRAPHLAASPGSRAHLPAEGGCSLPCGARPARRSERRLCPPWTAPAPASGCRSLPPPPPSCPAPLAEDAPLRPAARRSSDVTRPATCRRI